MTNAFDRLYCALTEGEIIVAQYAATLFCVTVAVHACVTVASLF